MRKLVLLLVIAALLAGCVQQAEVPENSVFKMKRFGAFTPMDMAVTEISIEPGELRYMTYDYEGELTRNVRKNVSSQQYEALRRAFSEADFKQLPEEIRPKELVADVGAANVTLIHPGYAKTINIDPYYTPELSEELQDLLEQIEGMISYALDMPYDEAEQYAGNWIIDSPTYAYDGSGLELMDHAVLESYPVQHVMTFNFTSSHAGYGNRSGQILAQVMTPHTVRIEVVEGRVVSAVMDEKWDMIDQAMVGGNVELAYQPMQCQTTPWQEWYEDGNVQFVKEPTDEELITTYYSEMGVEVSGTSKVESGMAVCMACDTCPTSYYYTMEVPSHFEGELDGWKLINSTEVERETR